MEVSSFSWKCKSCGHVTTDSVDVEMGPFVTVICSACDTCFEDSELTADEVKAWDMAVLKALEGAAA